MPASQAAGQPGSCAAVGLILNTTEETMIERMTEIDHDTMFVEIDHDTMLE